MSKVFTNSPSTLTIVCYKNDLSWLNYLFMARFQLISMSSMMIKTYFRCVQSINIIVGIAKCVQDFHKYTQYTHFLSVTKNDLSWQKNPIMAWFQLITMSSNAKNKLLMCSVNQYHCRHRQMCGKVSQIQPVYSLFVCCKNDLAWLN